MNDSERKQVAKEVLWGLFFTLFGGYLIVGACMAFWNGEWPIIMPLQFDVIALFLKIFGEKVAAYLGVILLLITGVGCCWLGIRALSDDGNT
jgi:hypothetical protein